MKIFKVDLINNFRTKQLSWFINNYGAILDSEEMFLYFYKKPYECLEINLRSKIKSFFFNDFDIPYNVEEIKTIIDSYSFTVIPFRNKYKETALKSFSSNMDKIQNKAKVICKLDFNDFDNNLEKAKKVFGLALKMGFNNFCFLNFNDLSFTENKGIEQFNLPTNIQYSIDDKGNILSFSNNKLLSNIYKQPAYLIFS